ncbi:fused signal transduction protein/response regulator [Helicobacter sp. 13S00401-1]|uniref:chemotaxis protein n=1 Tax=Helicobacter sp. 13S00401-1 TaxID=1905758 RepID=UPI000BA7416E|nr:chemotaxis protein [Helicobacter sp. 13S00401-1]PAF51442.1 fused signal transduction protein/response regulator [Helicobacter sp. 13S00401-1]
MEKSIKTRGLINEIELVDFRISEQLDDGEVYEGIYGINVTKVQEIIQVPETFELPASPDYILGVFDLRGTVMPLVDLATWLGIKDRELKVPPSKKRVIIAEFNNLKLGFVVHEAKLIRRISWSNIEPASFSSSDAIGKERVTAVTRIEDGRTMLILDLEKILSDLDFYKDVISKQDKEERKRFSGTVLIVDDSTIARSLIKKSLKGMGFDVIEAKDGEAGLKALDEIVKEHPKDLHSFLKLIVSDVEMPRMDGFHFAQKIKDNPVLESIPLIFSSSICDKYSQQKGLDIGADAYIVKFNEEIFSDEIAKIME